MKKTLFLIFLSLSQITQANANCKSVRLIYQQGQTQDVSFTQLQKKLLVFFEGMEYKITEILANSDSVKLKEKGIDVFFAFDFKSERFNEDLPVRSSLELTLEIYKDGKQKDRSSLQQYYWRTDKPENIQDLIIKLLPTSVLKNCEKL